MCSSDLGLLENLVAMIKRNMNTPDLAGTVDITNMSISIVDNFFSSFVRDEVLLDHLDCVRASSIQSFSDWFSCQPTSAVGQLAISIS